MLHGRRHITKAVLLMIGMAAGASALVVAQDYPNIGRGPVTPAAASALTPLDQAHAWLLDARRNFTAVHDYTCTLSKRENVGGTLSEENIIEAKFRTQPFSVYMRWLSPSKLYGQEVAFIMGRNNNKMRVHSKGLIKGAVGFVSLDVGDRRVLEQSRHTIYEAGIGNLIEQALKYVEAEKLAGKAQARISDVVHDGRPCVRVEMVRTARRQDAEFYRTVLTLDRDAKFPVRAENYDWPRSGGAPAGELMEQVTFTGLRWNLGLTEKEFNK